MYVRSLIAYEYIKSFTVLGSTGELLISWLTDGKVKLWDLLTGSCIYNIRIPGYVGTALFPLNESEFIMGDEIGQLRVWKLNGYCSVEDAEEEEEEEDENVHKENKMWRRAQRLLKESSFHLECKHVVEGHKADVISIFRPTRRGLISSSWEEEIKVWIIGKLRLLLT